MYFHASITIIIHAHYRFAWSHEVICDVLHEEGFSKIELAPFEVDPSYSGDLDLQAYIKLHDYKLILAWK